MIKARGQTKSGKPVYFFGLSARNIELLKADKPIDISLEELGHQARVIIMYGETEASITKQLIDVGVKLPE